MNDLLQTFHFPNMQIVHKLIAIYMNIFILLRYCLSSPFLWVSACLYIVYVYILIFC